MVENSATLSGDVVCVARWRMLFSHVFRVSASLNLVARVVFHLVSCSIWVEIGLSVGVIIGVVADRLFFPICCSLAKFRILFSFFHSG